MIRSPLASSLFFSLALFANSQAASAQIAVEVTVIGSGISVDVDVWQTNSPASSSSLTPSPDPASIFVPSCQPATDTPYRSQFITQVNLPDGC